MMLVEANGHDAAARLQATMNACATRWCPVEDPTRAPRLPNQLLQQIDGVIMWEPWNLRSRELLIKLAVLSAGGRACNRVRWWWIGRVWRIARTIVVFLLQKLNFHLLAFVFVVRHSNHATEAGVPHPPGDEGL